MSWLSSGGSSFDSEKLAAEIESELKRRRAEGDIPESDPAIERAFSGFEQARRNEGLIALAENYADGLDEGQIAKRAPLLFPVVKPLLKILARIFKNQFILNSLLLEIIRDQESRLKGLESRLPTMEHPDVPSDPSAANGL